MTKGEVSTRLNWGIDKLLLGVVAFFAIRTYDTIDVLVMKVQTMETEIALLKSAIRILKLDL